MTNTPNTTRVLGDTIYVYDANGVCVHSTPVPYDTPITPRTFVRAV